MGELSNLGVIGRISFPDDWTVEQLPPMGGKSVTTIALGSDPKVVLVLTVAELPLSADCAASFKSVLYSQFHSVSQEELSGLAEFLGPLLDGKHFSLDKAETGYLLNRRALTLEGLWLGDARAIRSFYLDLDGRAFCYQNICYSAPPDSFEKNLPVVSTIVSSIEWTEDK